MAEAVVSIALETFRDLLLEEARFLSGVGDQVKALEAQLKEIRCFLEDADRRRHESKTVFNYIVEIKDLAYRAEAAIELHAARVSSRRRRGLRHLIRRCSCILEECYSIHQVGSEISQINSGIASATQKLRDYGIHRDGGESSSAANNSQNWSRKTFPDFKIDDCFVGMEVELKQLEFLLMEDKEHRVISVWGMGGSGKTTIARKVYNHIKERAGFESFAWVCISQQCQIRSVLEDILSQLRPQRNENISTSLSDTALMEELCKIQREKRCLIVVDDLWETSHWDGLNHAFLVRDLQSKILVTTRERKVAEVGFPVELGLLSINKAWELLKKRAFPDFAPEENLEKIGKEMVRKCGYLPLAISLLGGILRKKKSMKEWELVNENINTLIYKDENEIDGVLILSYENLPFYLKPCFLYMGMFKEDQSIRVDRLYKMWIVQGMISHENVQDKEKTLMDIAELYLSELASRSIVEVEIYDGVTPARKYWSCKLHDIVRELCLKIGKNEEFGLQILEYQGGKLSTILREASSHIRIRHLTIHFKGEVEVENDELIIPCGEDASKYLRSLQIFNHVNLVEFPLQGIVDFQKFKLLRDLVIKRFKFAGRKLPRGITNLVHLRCLRLQECEVDELPSYIRKLVYLETLDLCDSKNVRIPNVLKKMLRLKHLILPLYDREIIGNYRVRLDEGVDELETLMCLDSRVHELKSMDIMTNLRRFSASMHDNESLLGIMNAIAIMNKLVFCVVAIKEGCELASSEEVWLKKAFACPNLHTLLIDVKLGKALAECGRDSMSSKLTSLILSECEIEDDPMGILGKLPSLRDLCLLSKSFTGEEMTCPSLSFPRLKMLCISSLPKLREWRVEVGAMPLLSQLEIDDCPYLKMLPNGLSHISTLQKLEIYGMPELGKRVSLSGEDFHKVCHVSSIIIQEED